MLVFNLKRLPVWSWWARWFERHCDEWSVATMKKQSSVNKKEWIAASRSLESVPRNDVFLVHWNGKELC